MTENLIYVRPKSNGVLAYFMGWAAQQIASRDEQNARFYRCLRAYEGCEVGALRKQILMVSFKPPMRKVSVMFLHWHESLTMGEFCGDRQCMRRPNARCEDLAGEVIVYVQTYFRFS